MPYAVLEKEIERLDETQQNTVVLFVRFLLSQKAAAAKSVSADERPRKYDFSDLIGKVKFDGDPVAYQRSLRDEWQALRCLHRGNRSRQWLCSYIQRRTLPASVKGGSEDI